MVVRNPVVCARALTGIDILSSGRLFAGIAPGSFFSHMDLATLFFCKVSDIYLENKGRIAFAMPKSVLTAMQHSN
jgi:hypothetical protein